jgi:hypothetical protein
MTVARSVMLDGFEILAAVKRAGPPVHFGPSRGSLMLATGTSCDTRTAFASSNPLSRLQRSAGTMQPKTTMTELHSPFALALDIDIHSKTAPVSQRSDGMGKGDVRGGRTLCESTIYGISELIATTRNNS